VVIHRIQADSFHKFNSIPAFILPQSENISATNGRMVAPFCLSAKRMNSVIFNCGNTLSSESELNIAVQIKVDIEPPEEGADGLSKEQLEKLGLRSHHINYRVFI
jgi:hypothetical protein